MMHKSQFRKIDTYDWFYGPGSHIILIWRAEQMNAGDSLVKVWSGSQH